MVGTTYRTVRATLPSKDTSRAMCQCMETSRERGRSVGARPYGAVARRKAERKIYELAYGAYRQR